MKMSKYYIFFLFIFYSCDKITSPKIDAEIGDYGSTYSIELHGLNTGSYIDVCTLQWNQNNNENFTSYIIRNNIETIITIDQSQINTYIKQLEPGVFEKIYIDVQTEFIDTDSIEIYSRPIKPITNLTAAANANNWFTTLTWTPSDEDSSSFEKYNIYRSEITLDNFMLIAEIDTQNTSEYIDTITTWGYEYYYKIETNTNQDYSRNSIIQSNIINNTSNYPVILNTTNGQYNNVTLSWEHELNQQEFYALEIWRTNDEDGDPLDGYLLATVLDHTKNVLEDSYQIGNGISWFYKIKLIDQFGNISYSSIATGKTHP